MSIEVNENEGYNILTSVNLTNIMQDTILLITLLIKVAQAMSPKKGLYNYYWQLRCMNKCF